MVRGRGHLPAALLPQELHVRVHGPHPRKVSLGVAIIAGNEGSRRFHNYGESVTELVGTFNQEKALVGAFSVIVKSSGTSVSSCNNNTASVT